MPTVPYSCRLPATSFCIIACTSLSVPLSLLSPLYVALSAATAALSSVETARLDTAALYAEHCATCHGSNGDGKGTADLDRPARSFLDGGYSYGNTQ